MTLHFCLSEKEITYPKTGLSRYAPGYRLCRAFHRLPHHEMAKKFKCPLSNTISSLLRTSFAIQNGPVQFSFLKLWSRILTTTSWIISSWYLWVIYSPQNIWVITKLYYEIATESHHIASSYWHPRSKTCQEVLSKNHRYDSTQQTTKHVVLLVRLHSLVVLGRQTTVNVEPWTCGKHVAIATQTVVMVSVIMGEISWFVPKCVCTPN